MSKKPKFAILGGLFSGLNEAAQERARLGEHRSDSEEKLLALLSELSLKSQLKQLDPETALNAEYKRALISQANAQTGRLENPPPSAFDQKLNLFTTLNPPPNPLSPDSAISQAGSTVMPKFQQFLQGRGRMPVVTSAVQDVFNNQKNQETDWRNKISGFLGGKSDPLEGKIVTDTIKHLNKLDPDIDTEEYYKTLSKLVKQIGKDKALEYGYIDQADIDSGLLEGI